MADIFKPRKVPKHLIIQEPYQYNRKSKPSLLKWALWILALLFATGMALEWRYLSSI